MLRVNHLAGFGKNRPSSGSSYDTDAQAFFTAAGITDTTQKDAVNQLVLDLKSASIWTKCNAIYPFVGGDATKHSYNLKNTAAYQIAWSGTVTHDANGITGNGSTGYGDTGLNCSSVLTLNDTHLGVYSRTTGGSSDSMYEIGAQTGSGASSAAVFMGVRRLDTFFSGMYNRAFDSDSQVNVANTSTAAGFWLVSRRSSTDMEAYKNGSTFGNAPTGTNSGSLPNANLFIAAMNTAGTAESFSNRNLAFATIGTSLTDTEAANFYTAVQAFQTTLGRQV